METAQQTLVRLVKRLILMEDAPSVHHTPWYRLTSEHAENQFAWVEISLMPQASADHALSILNLISQIEKAVVTIIVQPTGS